MQKRKLKGSSLNAVSFIYLECVDTNDNTSVPPSWLYGHTSYVVAEFDKQYKVYLFFCGYRIAFYGKILFCTISFKYT
jgi:hypothetical protein